MTDELKWRLCKAAQQLQIPLLFVCDDGVVTPRNELVQKCLCLEVRHESQNVKQALQRVMQRNGLNMLEACLSIAIACGHDVRKAISAAQTLGQRSSSSELPTADFSASAASLHILLPSDTTDVPEVLELLEQDGEELCRVLQCPCLTSLGESFETLHRCAFAAKAMALGEVAECAASRTAWAEDTSDYTTNGFYLGAVSTPRKQRCHHSAQACPMESSQMIQVSAFLIATLSTETGLLKGRLGQPLDRSQSIDAQHDVLLVINSSPTELASKAVAQNDINELDRTLEDQDERRWADERRTSNAENEIEGELMRGDDHGKNRMEVSTNEEDSWTLAEKHEDIHDDVVFVDVDWNENAAVFKQKDLLDTVLALDADNIAPNDKVVKEAEAVIVEGEAVDFLEVDVDRKHGATLRDVVIEEVLVPALGAPQTGGRVDRFPQGSGRMRFVSAPLWSLRPLTCEPELWLIIGKAAQSEMRAKWQADDRDAFAAQEERCSSWRRAKRGGVVACGVQGPLVDGGGELPGAGSAGDGHACSPCAPVRAINNEPVVTSVGGLLAQRARRRCDTCVETLAQQARTPTVSSTHGHAFLELYCASDSEVAAVVVEHFVVIRVTSFEDVQLTSRRLALHRLLMICGAYVACGVVANIWVSIPCVAGTPFTCINEKLGAQTGDLAMTKKLEVTAVGLCRHGVRIGDGFSWKWSIGNELWKSVVVRNLFARSGSSSCVGSPPQLWDNNLSIARGACSTTRRWKILRRSQERHTLTSSVIGCALLKTMLTATDSTHRCNRMP